MYKSRRDVIPLSPDDEVVIDLGFSAPGVLSWASVNYRAFIAGKWREVTRYDNAHGIPHRHRFWLRNSEQNLPIGTTPTQLIQAAKHDILRAWPKYRQMLEATL